MARILSIEDSADLQQLLGVALQARGFEVHYAFNGKEGWEKVLSLDPDLVLLDLMIPVMNGVAVIEKMRACRETRAVPIIIITAYGDDADMLSQSLKALGALDYLRKPFEMRQLIARIETVLSRSPMTAPAAPARELRKGNVRLNLKFRTVWVDDHMVARLPNKLAGLLKALLEARKGVSREQLLQRLWPDGGGSSGTIEKTVERLRKSLGEHGDRLQTLPSGYEFVA